MEKVRVLLKIMLKLCTEEFGRSRDGSQTSEIELATKILDCDGECIMSSAGKIGSFPTY